MYLELRRAGAGAAQGSQRGSANVSAILGTPDHDVYYVQPFLPALLMVVDEVSNSKS